MMNKEVFRKCIVTQEILPKSKMIRVVKTKEMKILISNVAQGKGAYIKKDIEVLKKAEKLKSLNRVFRTQIEKEIYQNLYKFAKENNVR